MALARVGFFDVKKFSEGEKAKLLIFGAGNGDRTRDPRLGKPMLYQLSYARNSYRNLTTATL